MNRSAKDIAMIREMLNMMERKFLPVGQGAFYCEKFYFAEWGTKLNVIYDCGSSTDLKIVQGKIKENFEKGETIEALIISHLDEDHINGIQYLLQYCTVKKIYFPLISSQNSALMKIGFEIRKCDPFVVEFLNNPLGAINSLQLEYEPIFVQIREHEDEGYSSFDMANSIPSGQNLMNDIINANKKHISGLLYDWEYIPYNFRQADRIRRLMDALRGEFQRQDIKINEIEELWRNGGDSDRKKIKAAYKKVPGSFNTNSMVLFSGIRHTYCYQTVACPCRCICSCNSCRYMRFCCKEQVSGCLYMGDYDAAGKNKWMQLKKAYRMYWDSIGCVQVPHHGSKHNFNPKLLEFRCIYVISAGFSNRYRHPHASVVKQFLFNHVMPYIVTEKDESELVTFVNL